MEGYPYHKIRSAELDKASYVGNFAQITIQKVIENQKFMCPRECFFFIDHPNSCHFKKELMYKPLEDRLICTTVLVDVKSMLPSERGLLEIRSDKICIIDSRGYTHHCYRPYICSEINSVIKPWYGHVFHSGWSFALIHENAKQAFLLVFPQVPSNEKVARVILEVRANKGNMVSSLETFDFGLTDEVLAKLYIEPVPEPSDEQAAMSEMSGYRSLEEISKEAKTQYKKLQSQKQRLFTEIPSDILCEQLIKYIRRAIRQYVAFDDKRLHRSFQKFWTDTYPTVTSYPNSMDPNIKFKRYEVESQAMQILQKDRLNYIRGLSQQFVQWAGKRNLKKLSKADTKLFLAELKIKLPVSMEDMLYREGKLKYRYLPPWLK